MFQLFGPKTASPDQPAPLPAVPDARGNSVDLAGLVAQGKHLVLWFYPKANSPGCTMQAKRYADLYDEFKAMNVEVFGVSPDPASAQCRFIDRLATEGGMLPDTDGALAKAYGVGNQLFGYRRDTFLVNPQGRVERAWLGANPLTDASTVYEYLREKLDHAGGRGV